MHGVDSASCVKYRKRFHLNGGVIWRKSFFSYIIQDRGSPFDWVKYVGQNVYSNLNGRSFFIQLILEQKQQLF